MKKLLGIFRRLIAWAPGDEPPKKNFFFFCFFFLAITLRLSRTFWLHRPRDRNFVPSPRYFIADGLAGGLGDDFHSTLLRVDHLLRLDFDVRSWPEMPPPPIISADGS